MNKISLLALLLGLCLSLHAQEKPEPHFEEYYFLDKKGERLEGSVTVDEKYIYLVIVSSNAIGDKVVLTLDKDEKYFYKKDLLLGGTSVKFPIKSDIEKIKLVIYNPNKKKHVKLKAKTEANLAVTDTKD